MKHKNKTTTMHIMQHRLTPVNILRVPIKMCHFSVLDLMDKLHKEFDGR